jgi:23S rRNA (guanosine2251-2'-O)-methyltransferase
MREWIIGRNAVMEVLQAKRRDVFKLLLATGIEEKGRIQELLKLANSRKCPVERVPKERLAKMGDNPQGVAIEVSGYPYVNLVDIIENAKSKNEDLFILLLDMIQNPQNLGTLLRTAEAAGVHGIIIPQHRAAEVTPAVVNSSSGASEHMLIAQANLALTVEELKQKDVWVVGLDGGPGSQRVQDIRLDGPIAIIVGNEGEGMRALVREKCDFLLGLPMRGKIESLNAAVAGSIVLYQVVLTREKTK